MNLSHHAIGLVVEDLEKKRKAIQIQPDQVTTTIFVTESAHERKIRLQRERRQRLRAKREKKPRGPRGGLYRKSTAQKLKELVREKAAKLKVREVDRCKRNREARKYIKADDPDNREARKYIKADDPDNREARKYTKADDPDWHPSISMSKTSEFYQDGGDGCKTIANARKKDAGWNTAEFSNKPAATKILEEHPELREQIKDYTTARCLNADINHTQYKELRELILKVLTHENNVECHSLKYLVRRMKHANRHKNAQLYAVYDAVDKLLGMKTRAASSFRCDPEKTERNKKKHLTLEDHQSSAAFF